MFFFFFFNDTATTEIYTLSLHDALPISLVEPPSLNRPTITFGCFGSGGKINSMLIDLWRSEEHTSELQSLRHLVCRLLLEKKKKKVDSQSAHAIDILYY